MMKLRYGCGWLVMMLAACTTTPSKIAPVAVDPVHHEGLDCAGIAAAILQTRSRMSLLAAHLDRAVRQERNLMGFGVVMHWPAVFEMGANRGQTYEYGRLKGELEMLRTLAAEKKCAAPAATG